MTCIDGGEKAVAVGEGTGANRNDGRTLTSNKLNRGPGRHAPRRNAIKYRINTGVRLYMTGGEACADKEGTSGEREGLLGVNITRRDQSHQRERRRPGQCY